MRTHTCGELTEREEGNGWFLLVGCNHLGKLKVDSLRDITRRLRRNPNYETSEIQPVDDADDHRSPKDGREVNVSQLIPLESVVCVEGVVQTRPASQVKKTSLPVQLR